MVATMCPSVTRLALIACIALLALSLSSCWYVRQGTRFLSERAGAVPVSRLLADPGLDPALRDFLTEAEALRRFAVETLGLSPTENYTRYVALERDYVADVVSACAADSFTRHLWRYPVVGALPYKGFYDKSEADAEAARLRAAGLDVISRRVDAFSSLGYFKDPLYSFMLAYGPDELAELVIHESAHATLFVKGAEQFNEEFATFVGRAGAERYLQESYGPDSEEARRRTERLRDRAAFAAYLTETARLLEEAYADPALDREARLARKAAVIADRAGAYAEGAAGAFADPGYASFDMARINNAYLDLYRLYEEDLGLYERWLEGPAAGSLVEFVSSLKALAAKAGPKVKEAMARRLEER